MGTLSKAHLEKLLSHYMRRRGISAERSGARRRPSKAVVLDNGSGMLNAGFVGEEAPRAVLESPAAADGVKGLVLACEAALRRLKVAPEEAAILLIEPPHLGPRGRVEAAAGLFKGLGIAALAGMAGPPLALIARGQTTGVVVDVGPRGVDVTGVDDTAVVEGAGRRLVLGAPEAASRLSAALRLDALFQPRLTGLEQEGIHRQVAASIDACEPARRGDLYANVVLTGAAVSFPGIDVRLARELVALAPDSMTVEVASAPAGDTPVWRAAAGLASLSTFEEMWIPRDEYDESGPGIVGRKWT